MIKAKKSLGQNFLIDKNILEKIVNAADISNKTILEISKNIDDPSKLEDLIGLLDERKKQPLDYRRNGVVSLFVGIGLFLFGLFFLGDILKGVGALVAAIGVGQIIAGYLYPNTSEEITNAVDAFEKK